MALESFRRAPAAQPEEVRNAEKLPPQNPRLQSHMRGIQHRRCKCKSCEECKKGSKLLAVGGFLTNWCCLKDLHC